jgi:hypothetical protein
VREKNWTTRRKLAKFLQSEKVSVRIQNVFPSPRVRGTKKKEKKTVKTSKSNLSYHIANDKKQAVNLVAKQKIVLK